MDETRANISKKMTGGGAGVESLLLFQFALGQNAEKPMSSDRPVMRAARLCFPDALILAYVGGRLKAMETERERVRKEGLRLLSQ